MRGLTNAVRVALIWCLPMGLMTAGACYVLTVEAGFHLLNALGWAGLWYALGTAALIDRPLKGRPDHTERMSYVLSGPGMILANMVFRRLLGAGS